MSLTFIKLKHYFLFLLLLFFSNIHVAIAQTDTEIYQQIGQDAVGFETQPGRPVDMYIFIDPYCPFSKKAYQNIRKIGADQKYNIKWLPVPVIAKKYDKIVHLINNNNLATYDDIMKNNASVKLKNLNQTEEKKIATNKGLFVHSTDNLKLKFQAVPLGIVLIKGQLYAVKKLAKLEAAKAIFK